MTDETWFVPLRNPANMLPSKASKLVLRPFQPPIQCLQAAVPRR